MQTPSHSGAGSRKRKEDARNTCSMRAHIIISTGNLGAPDLRRGHARDLAGLFRIKGPHRPGQPQNVPAEANRPEILRPQVAARSWSIATARGQQTSYLPAPKYQSQDVRAQSFPSLSTAAVRAANARHALACVVACKPRHVCWPSCPRQQNVSGIGAIPLCARTLHYSTQACLAASPLPPQCVTTKKKVCWRRSQYLNGLSFF